MYADNPAYRLVPTIVGAQSPILLDEGSPDDVISTSNTLFLKFISNNDGQFPGFNATFQKGMK